MPFLRNHPLIRITVCFLIGIRFTHLIPSTIFLVLGIILVHFLLSKLKPGRLKFYALSISTLTLFICLGALHGQRSIVKPLHKSQTYLIQPIRTEHKSKGVRVEAYVYADSFGGSGEKASLFFYKADSIQLDQWIQVELKLEIPQGPVYSGAFNYRQFLRTKRIFYSGFITADKWQYLNKEAPFSVYRLAFKTQLILKSRINEYVKGDAAEILSALLLGSKSELNPEIQARYRNSGTMHMLAVSGMHVGILYLILTQLFRLLPSRLLRFLATAICLSTFAFITGLSPSVMRAVILFTLMHTGTLFNRSVGAFNMLACSALMLASMNPFIIYAVGFQLSYLAVFGILLLTPKLDAKFGSKKRWIFKIQQLVHVSLAAQLFTTPLALFYFGSFPLYFLLGNLIVVPLAAPMLCGGILLLILSPFPSIATVLGQALSCLLDFNSGAAASIGELPFATLRSVNFSLGFLLIIYFSLLLILQFVTQRKRMALAWLLLLGTFILSNRLMPTSPSSLQVFNSGSDLIVACVSPQRQFIYADTTAFRKQDFTINTFHQKHSQVDKIVLKRNANLSVGEQRLAILSNSTESSIDTDVLILHSRIKFYPKELLSQHHFRKLVLASKEQILEPWPLGFDKSAVHILSEDGYFEHYE